MKNMVLLASLMGLMLYSQPAPRKISSSIPAGALQGDATPLLVSFRKGKLYKLDINTGEESLIFTLRYKRHQYLKIAPNGGLLAFAEKKSGQFHTAEARHQGRPDVWGKAYIRVISPDGELLHTLEDGLKFAWSPDGNKIAYVTYDLNDADYTYKSPTGLWIYDLETGERRRISRYAQRLKWAEFDNNLYFTQSLDVLRYSSESGVIDSTDYAGIDFSPDGQYYFLRYDPMISHKRQIYDTATNEVFLNERQMQFPQIVARGTIINIVDWINGRKSILLIRTTTYDSPPPVRGASKVNYLVQIVQGESIKHFLFDVETRRVIKEFEGLPSKWIGNNKIIVVERDGKVILEEIPNRP
ncbi:MAG: PD40 domain-containing protein [Candidatus Marinimicrobia bacterium]|nr:PD40 domain-containing protein [Candidatus Neomarinimicrobiota bacterium]